MKPGKESKKLPPFVPMFWEMLNSLAYKEVSASAAKALPLFLGKVKLHYKDIRWYHTNFSFSYAEGKRLGFAYSTFFKVIQDLMAFGFIDPVDRGGLRGNSKTCSLFKLSFRWKAYGTDDFKSIDWKSFEPKL